MDSKEKIDTIKKIMANLIWWSKGEEISCAGKKKYITAKSAEQQTKKSSPRQRLYFCYYCNNYHTGPLLKLEDSDEFELKFSKLSKYSDGSKYESSCEGKDRFSTALNATAHAVYGKDKGYLNGVLDVYFCSHCGGYHIGHNGKHVSQMMLNSPLNENFGNRNQIPKDQPVISPDSPADITHKGALVC